MPSHLEILGLIFDRLKSDTSLVALVGSSDRISNHLPQDTAPNPAYIRARVDETDEWDTKDSDGFEHAYVVDVWTELHGDKRVREIFDRVYQLLHRQPFTGSTSQSLLLRMQSTNTFIEPDGVTHHGVMNFRHIYTD